MPYGRITLTAALILSAFAGSYPGVAKAQSKGSGGSVAKANEEVSTPQAGLRNSVEDFLDASRTKKLISAKQVFEMFNWLLKTSRDARELPAKEQEKAIRNEVASMKRTYRFVSDSAIANLGSGAVKFHNRNTSAKSNATLKSGELLLDRGIVGKAGLFCKYGGMTTDQTLSFAETLMGTDPTAIRKAIIAQRGSYETNGRAYRFGTQLDELVGGYVESKTSN